MTKNFATILLGCLAAACATSTVPTASYQVDTTGFATQRASELVALSNFVRGDSLYTTVERPPESYLEFQAVLEEIKDTVIAANTYSYSHISVIPSDCGGYGAFTEMSGDIEVCWLTLLEAESVDELAFQVCHEMAHLLMGDLDESQWIRRGAELNSFNAQRELTADLVGIDLCVTAGYQPSEAYFMAAKRAEASSVSFSVESGSSAALSTDQNRPEIIREYIRAHYEPQIGNLSTTQLPPSYLAAQINYVGLFDQVAEITSELRSVDYPFGESPVDPRCPSLAQDISEIGPQLDYPRYWFGLLVAHAQLCKSRLWAIDQIEAPLSRPHANAEMALLQATFFDHMVYLEPEGRRRLGINQIGLNQQTRRYWRRALNPSLFPNLDDGVEARTTLGLAGVRLAHDDLDAFQTLMADFREECVRFPEWRSLDVCRSRGAARRFFNFMRAAPEEGLWSTLGATLYPTSIQIFGDRFYAGSLGKKYQ